MQWARIRIVLFKVFYSTAFTSVFLLLLAHIALTPTDSIYQSYRDGRYFDIIIVAAVYILTGLLAILIYASRLYTNRSVLKDIPKTYIPVEAADLPRKRVRALIEESLARSAVIAYLAKPRSYKIEDESASITGRISALTNFDLRHDRSKGPTWGCVAHPGWTSPDSPDLPNLQYETVVKELPDLIEAKAVSLAPIDPMAPPSADGLPMPDENVIEILRRPPGMGMRPYFGQLMSLGVIEDSALSRAFLTLYEQARFAADPMTERDFRSLMNMFAELLRGMSQLDSELLPEPEHENFDVHDRSSGQSTFSDGGSVRHRYTGGPPRRVSEDSVPSMSEEDHEDDRSSRIQAGARSLSRPTQRSNQVSTRSNQHSLRQTRSNVSASSSGRSSRSGGSIIRLTGAGDHTGLPYTINIPRVDTL